MLKKVGPFGFSNASTGGHSARSMMFREACEFLFVVMPLTATKDDFTKTIVEENVLEKPTMSSRKKSLRHLIELYGMDPSETLFRVLWQLGHADLESLPQLCLVCAYARDLHPLPRHKVCEYWFVHCAWARFLTDQAWSSISKVVSLVASVLL